jgi:hypothetical protein
MLWLLGLCLLAARPAMAQSGDDATRSAARALAEQGLALYDKGDCPGALDALDRAEALVRAPTLALHAARCLERLGRLVEASERYMSAQRMPLGADASEAFREAQADAAREREALLPRLPSLEIVLEGARPEEATVTLDGKPVPAVLVGVGRPVNPGSHRVEARRGEATASETVTLAEAERRRVVLRLPPATALPAHAVAPSPPAPEARGVSSGAALRTLGWVGVGIGGAGILIGAVSGGLALGKRAELDDGGCVEERCPPTLGDDVDAYNSLRTLSGAALIAGAVLASAGVVMLVVAPTGEELTLDARPLGASIHARF